MEFQAAQEVEVRKKRLKPAPSREMAEAVLRAKWGVEVALLKSLESYDDCNFFVQAVNTNKTYLLKFVNGVESANRELLAGFGAMTGYLTAHCPSLRFPCVVPTGTGEDTVFLSDCDTFAHEQTIIAVRLFDWVEGQTLSDKGSTEKLLMLEGKAVGKMSAALKNFDHPGLHRIQFWDGQYFSVHVRPFVSLLEDSNLRGIIEGVIHTFEESVLPVSSQFQLSAVMSDCNDANIIVSDDGSDIVGFIDFGDATYSWGILELANALAYGLCTSVGLENPILSIMNIFAGYCRTAIHRAGEFKAVSEIEIRHLHALIAVRLATSVTVGAYSISKDPSNEYLKLHALPGRQALRSLVKINSSDFENMLSLIQEEVILIAKSGVELEPSFESAKLYLSKYTVKAEHRDEESKDVSITFVTGNAKKLEEVQCILGSGFPFKVKSRKIDLPELQGEPEVVAREKCRLAAMEVNCPQTLFFFQLPECMCIRLVGQ
jgi:Ser/Thr protein kinase RdoA (MazF antagonist)